MTTSITTIQSHSEPSKANERMTLLLRAMSTLTNFSKMNEIEKIKMRQHLKETQELWTKLLWQLMVTPGTSSCAQGLSERKDELVIQLPQLVKKKRGRPGKLKPLCAG